MSGISAVARGQSCDNPSPTNANANASATRGSSYGGAEVDHFDICMLNFIAADGQATLDHCTSDGPRRCAGFVLIDNDFRSDGYGSTAEAVRTVVPHQAGAVYITAGAEDSLYKLATLDYDSTPTGARRDTPARFELRLALLP